MTKTLRDGLICAALVAPISVLGIIIGSLVMFP